MLKVKRHKLFIKDFRNIKFSDQHFTKFVSYISKLIEKQPLPKEALDHALSGDLLVIYLIDDDTLNLIRIGSHSQLFK